MLMSHVRVWCVFAEDSKHLLALLLHPHADKRTHCSYTHHILLIDFRFCCRPFKEKQNFFGFFSIAFFLAFLYSGSFFSKCRMKISVSLLPFTLLYQYRDMRKQARINSLSVCIDTADCFVVLPSSLGGALATADCYCFCCCCCCSCCCYCC